MIKDAKAKPRVKKPKLTKKPKSPKRPSNKGKGKKDKKPGKKDKKSKKVKTPKGGEPVTESSSRRRVRGKAPAEEQADHVEVSRRDRKSKRKA